MVKYAGLPSDLPAPPTPRPQLGDRKAASKTMQDALATPAPSTG